MKSKEIAQLELKIMLEFNILRGFDFNVDAGHDEEEHKRNYDALQEKYKELTGSYFFHGLGGKERGGR